MTRQRRLEACSEFIAGAKLSPTEPGYGARINDVDVLLYNVQTVTPVTTGRAGLSGKMNERNDAYGLTPGLRSERAVAC